MTGWQVAGFLACLAVATFAQSITGFALALILLGLTGLFELAPLADVANVATVTALFTSAIHLRGARKGLDWPMMRSTIVGSVIGVAVGVALLGWLSANVQTLLRLLLGLVVIGCAVIVLLRTHPLPQRSSNASFQGFGFLSGVLGGLFSASGPPLVYQFYRQPLDLRTLRDTLMASLAFGGVIRVVMVVASGQFSLRSLGLCTIAVPTAGALTWWIKRHPPGWDRAVVLKIVCVLLTITGIGLVAPTIAPLAATIRPALVIGE
jgi:uncharacterized membrane protein YfcA